MYKSPIEIIYNNIAETIELDTENNIMKAVHSYGIVVDKDELVQALRYDREQYSKGYKDGYNDAMNKVQAIYSQLGGIIHNV